MIVDSKARKKGLYLLKLSGNSGKKVVRVVK
jgi:hypothetical protein